MKKLTLLLSILINIALFSQGGNSFFSVKGNKIVSPEGEAIFLKGINLGNWLVPEGYMFKFDKATSGRLINSVFSELLGPDEAMKFWSKFRENYITYDDIKYIKSLGMNSIRLPFDFRLFTPEEYPEVWLDTGFKIFDKIISWCKKENIYLILDMHCTPGGQTGDNIDNSWGYPYLFESVKSQNRLIEIWRKIAERYKDESVIIGYDFMNEPIATYFDADKLNPYLEPLYIKITNEVRKVDKNHIIFPGGAQWNTNFNIFGQPFDDKLVYNFHKYWCDTTQENIQEYLDFRDKYNVPLWMSESGENTDEWVAGWRRMMEKNDISWCFWPYKKMDAKSCIVQFDKPEGYDLIIEYANASRNSFADIRKLRPDTEKVKKALDKFLENSLFRNCKPNEGYIKALGL